VIQACTDVGLIIISRLERFGKRLTYEVPLVSKFDSITDPNGAQLYGIYSKTKLPVYGGYHMPKYSFFLIRMEKLHAH
jgi:hypothetical protein